MNALHVIIVISVLKRSAICDDKILSGLKGFSKKAALGAVICDYMLIVFDMTPYFRIHRQSKELKESNPSFGKLATIVLGEFFLSTLL